MQKAWKKNNNTGADYDIQCENLEIASLKSSFTGTSMATTKKQGGIKHRWRRDLETEMTDMERTWKQLQEAGLT